MAASMGGPSGRATAASEEIPPQPMHPPQRPRSRSLEIPAPPVNLHAGVWSRGRRALLDLLLPPRCLACGLGDARAAPLCAGCQRELPWLGPACRVCALPLPAASSEGRCGRCLRRPPPQHSTRALFVYRDPVDRFLGGLKFAADLAAGRWLADMLAQQWSIQPAAPVIDAIVPLPLHRARLRQRGYNQALELARALPKVCGCRLRPELLQRLRATPAQLGLSAGERRRNLRGAFVAAPAVQGLRLLLVDDVITTGSSVSEAARCLLRAGAAEVHVLAAARVPRRGA